MAITLNFSTGEIGWSSSTGTVVDPGDDISGGLDNLLLEDGSFLLLETGTEDVLLLE
jgi:hypothetical protein